MPIDYANLPDWLHWLVALAIILAALGALIVFIRKTWPILTRFVATMNSLADLPQFMITTARTLADQDEGAVIRDKKIEEIHHEVQYNNGSSVKDAIARVEKGVAGLYTREEIDAKNAQLSDEIENTRPVIRKPAARKRSYKPKEQ